MRWLKLGQTDKVAYILSSPLVNNCYISRSLIKIQSSHILLMFIKNRKCLCGLQFELMFCLICQSEKVVVFSSLSDNY